MNRYDLLPHLQKSLTQSPTPSTSFTPTKPSSKLSIPNPFQTDSLRIEIVEPFDPKPQIHANQLTFKRQHSNSSLKNPFSEDYLQSNNTEHVNLNASLMSPADFDNALDSPSVMEIPSERHQDIMILTTYNNYKERSKPSETLDTIETPLTTDPDTTIAASPRKNLSYSITEGSDKSIGKRTSTSSHKKSSIMNSSTAKKSKKKDYERILEEIMQREKENRDVSSQGDSECPMTPTLGKPFSFCSSSQRRKSKGASSRKGDRDVSPSPMESLEKIKMKTEEAEKEREYLKVKVTQLRMMVKKETEEIGRIEKSVKLMDHDMKSLNHKQKQTGKQGIDLKDQVMKIKDEVLKLLEEIDNNRKGLEVITEKIATEKNQVETTRDKNNTLRRWLADEIKDRETQKGLGVNLKKNKQRAAATHEGLERERQTYVRTLEDTIESGEKGV